MLKGVTGLEDLAVDLPAGTEVVVRREVQDVVESAVHAAIEGGDGIHQHIIVDGRLNDNTCGVQFFMELINIFDANKDYSARHSITRKRGNMDLNIVTRQAHVTGISTTKRSIGKSLPKTETVTVKFFRRG